MKSIHFTQLFPHCSESCSLCICITVKSYFRWIVILILLQSQNTNSLTIHSPDNEQEKETLLSSRAQFHNTLHNLLGINNGSKGCPLRSMSNVTGSIRRDGPITNLLVSSLCLELRVIICLGDLHSADYLLLFISLEFYNNNINFIQESQLPWELYQ